MNNPQELKPHNLQQASIIEASNPISNDDRISSITRIFEEISLNNPNIINNIIHDYKKNHFDLLSKDTDRITGLVGLISPHLSRAAENSAVKMVIGEKSFNELENETLKLLNNYQETQKNIENAYAFSFLNDMAKDGKISDVTKHLKAVVVDTTNKMAGNEATIDDLGRSGNLIEERIDKPLIQIAASLNLKKEKTFIDRIFN